MQQKGYTNTHLKILSFCLSLFIKYIAKLVIIVHDYELEKPWREKWFEKRIGGWFESTKQALRREEFRHLFSCSLRRIKAL